MRYTHWGGDGNGTTLYHASSYPNQVEFLAGLATAPADSGTSLTGKEMAQAYFSGRKRRDTVHGGVPSGRVREGEQPFRGLPMVHFVYGRHWHRSNLHSIPQLPGRSFGRRPTFRWIFL